MEKLGLNHQINTLRLQLKAQQIIQHPQAARNNYGN